MYYPLKDLLSGYLVIAFILCFLTTPYLGAEVPADDASDSVAQMMVKARDFIYQQQKPAGDWENFRFLDNADPFPPHTYPARATWGRRTAIATYALLASGEKPTDDRIVRAVDWLKKSDQAPGCYVYGFQLLVWMNLPQTAEVKMIARQDADKISRMFTSDNLAWYEPQSTYGNNAIRSDTCNAQIGALGLWAATYCDVKVPRRA